VMEALKKAGRMDLVGYDRHCLIRPRQPKQGSGEGFRKQVQGKSQAKAQGKGKQKKKAIRNVHKKKQ